MDIARLRKKRVESSRRLRAQRCCTFLHIVKDTVFFLEPGADLKN